MLYTIYDINILKILQNLVMYRKDNQRNDKYEKNSFNELLRLTVIDIDPKSYFFDLTEQQVRNLYLNIKEDGLLDKYTHE